MRFVRSQIPSSASIIRLAAIVVLSIMWPASGITQSRMSEPEFFSQALDATRERWIQFRNYDGKQWVYFTGLVTWKCGLNAIRYSVNNRELDKQFPLPQCDPQLPFHVDPAKDKLYLTFAPETAKTVSVQLDFKNGSKSPARTYSPCNIQGDATCGILVE